MKTLKMKIFPFIIFFFTGISFSKIASAQYSWDWISGANGGCEGWAVCTDPWGNVFGLGFPYGSSVQFGSTTLTGFGGGAAIVVKYDASGNLVWAHSTQNASVSPISISADAAGNLYLLGQYASATTTTNATVTIESITLTDPVPGNNGMFLAKFSPSGSIDWMINIVTATSIGWYGLGGVATNGTDVYVTSSFKDPVVTIGTYTLTNTDPSGNTTDIFLTKIDGAGNIIWAKSAGGSSDDYPYGIAVTPSSNIYITGSYNSPTLAFGSVTITNSTGSNIFLAKYNGSGNALWAKTFGSGNENTYSVATDVNENAYIIGSFFTETLSFGSVSLTNTSVFHDVYLAKFTSSGTATWAKEIYGTSSLQGYGIAVDPCSNVWVSGSMGGGGITIDGNNLNAPPGGWDPMFIAGYNAAGTYITSAAIPTGGDDMNGICTDGVGNVFVGGDVAMSSVTLGTTMIDSGGENLFVAKFGLTQQKDTASSHISACVSEQLYAPPGYHTYLWSNGSTDSTATFDSAGTYWVQATGGCNSPLALYSFTVSEGNDCNKSSCAQALFVPNAFTPNGDGQDDVFYPRSGAGISLVKSFRVYNRWGQLLFERENIMPNDVSNAWDGTYQGDKPLPDVYVWVVDAVCENGKTFNKKGSITVIR